MRRQGYYAIVLPHPSAILYSRVSSSRLFRYQSRSCWYPSSRRYPSFQRSIRESNLLDIKRNPRVFRTSGAPTARLARFPDGQGPARSRPLQGGRMPKLRFRGSSGQECSRKRCTATMRRQGTSLRRSARGGRRGRPVRVSCSGSRNCPMSMARARWIAQCGGAEVRRRGGEKVDMDLPQWPYLHTVRCHRRVVVRREPYTLLYVSVRHQRLSHRRRPGCKARLQRRTRLGSRPSSTCCRNICPWSSPTLAGRGGRHR